MNKHKKVNINTDTKLQRYGKESNPEVLISKPVNNYTSGSMKSPKIDLFAPRGDNAKDAFDRELFDMLNDQFETE